VGGFHPGSITNFHRNHERGGVPPFYARPRYRDRIFDRGGKSAPGLYPNPVSR
jgi:hypothetical protein